MKILFFLFRPRRHQYLSANQILQELENLPSDSDISGASDGSDLDETYVPKDKIRDSSDDDEEEVVEDVGDVGEVTELPGDMGDNIPELPVQEGQLLDIDNLPEELLDLTDVLIESPHAQKQKKRRVSNVNASRDWLSEDLPPQNMPSSSVSPKQLEDCNSDAKHFVKMFGERNLELITYQTNLFRAQTQIEKNINIQENLPYSRIQPQYL